MAPEKCQSVLSAVQLEKKDALTLEGLEQAMIRIKAQGDGDVLARKRLA